MHDYQGFTAFCQEDFHFSHGRLVIIHEGAHVGLELKPVAFRLIHIWGLNLDECAFVAILIFLHCARRLGIVLYELQRLDIEARVVLLCVGVEKDTE